MQVQLIVGLVITGLVVLYVYLKKTGRHEANLPAVSEDVNLPAIKNDMEKQNIKINYKLDKIESLLINKKI